MGNTINMNANNIQKLTRACENPINILINGDEICKNQYGNNWKYVSIEKDNCEGNKLKGICEFNPNFIDLDIQEKPIKSIKIYNNTYNKDDNNNVNNNNKSCLINKKILYSNNNNNNNKIILSGNKKDNNMMNKVEYDEDIIVYPNSPLYSDRNNPINVKEPTILKNFPIKKMSTEKQKFPLQRKYIDQKKIDLPVKDNISKFIDQEATIYPKEQFYSNNSPNGDPQTCNFQNDFLCLSLFILVLLFIFFMVSRHNVKH